MADHAVTTSSGTLATLTEAECLSLLGSESVGRIAFVGDDGQQLIPVNFVVVDGLIYFRTSYDGLLAGFERGHDDVAFGVDHHEGSTHSGWNVTIRGHARRVQDRASINKILGDTRLSPWAGGVRPVVIEVSPKSIAGRRVFMVDEAAAAPLTTEG